MGINMTPAWRAVTAEGVMTKYNINASGIAKTWAVATYTDQKVHAYRLISKS